MKPRTALRASPFLLVLLLGIVTAAYAHTALRSSSPAEDERLTTAPSEIRLAFTTRVDPRLANVRLLAADSAPLRLDSLRAGDAPDVILAAVLEPLPPGVYTVAWQVVGTDGHPVRGRFAFAVDPVAEEPVPPSADAELDGVADPESAPARDELEGEAPDVLSPGYVATRWLTFATIVVIIGAAAFRTLVLESVRRRSNLPTGGSADEAASRAARLGRGAAGFLILTAAARLLLQARAVDADIRPDGMMRVMLLETPWGWGWLLQVAGALLALLAFQRAAANPRSGWGTATIAGLVLAFTPALSGHAAAVESAGPIAIAIDGLHVLAVSAWLGTLLALVAAGIPAAVRSGGGAAMIGDLVAVFSPLALVFVAVVVGTGAVSAVLHLESIGQLWTTGYGRTLVLKLAVVAVVVGTGAYNWRVVRPRLHDTGPSRLRRSAGMELIAAAIVLVITAMLVATPTP